MMIHAYVADYDVVHCCSRLGPYEVVIACLKYHVERPRRRYVQVISFETSLDG